LANVDRVPASASSIRRSAAPSSSFVIGRSVDRTHPGIERALVPSLGRHARGFIVACGHASPVR
jgi:hypothetical protein